MILAKSADRFFQNLAYYHFLGLCSDVELGGKMVGYAAHEVDGQAIGFGIRLYVSDEETAEFTYHHLFQFMIADVAFYKRCK